jgi:hypothetical protein
MSEGERMNVYGVVSETLFEGYSMYSYEPPEPYAIVDIVRARTHSQARYLAWKNSADGQSCGYDPMEMPRFSVKKLGECEGEAGVMTDSEADAWWERFDCVAPK